MYLQAVRHRLLLQVLDQGLFELLQDGSLQKIPGSDWLEGKTVAFILPKGDQADAFLIGTIREGIFQYENGQFQPWDTPANPFMISNQLNKGLQLSDGRYAFGTIRNGLFLTTTDGHVDMVVNQAAGLQNNTILALHEDSDGNLWLGLDRGIDLIALDDPLLYYQDRTGAIGTVYTAALHQGNLYVGTNQGVFRKPWASGEGRFQLVNGTQGQAWTLRSDRDQLLCGHNDGTFIIKKDGVDRLSSVTGGWSFSPVPGHPDWLLQSNYTGFALFKYQSGAGWLFSHRIADYNQPIKKVWFDTSGICWGLHPYEGMVQITFDVDFEKVEQFAFSGPRGPVQPAMLGDVFYLTYQGRVFQWQSRAKSWEPVEPPSGQPVKRFIPGRDDELFQVLDQTVAWQLPGDTAYFFQVNLIPNNEEIIPLDSNYYLFCQEDGYALLNKRVELPQKKPPPMPLLRYVRVYGSRNHQFTLLPIQAGLQNLSARENRVQFIFSQPLYSVPVRYRYQLEGFDAVWSDWTTSGEKEYSYLPAGPYRFALQANTADAPVVYFQFDIAPPWHQTGLAKMGYFLLTLLLLGFLLKWHQHRLERQQAAMEVRQAKALEEERIRATNAQLQADNLNKSRELLNTTMSLVRKNEILLQLKEELEAIKNLPPTQIQDFHQQHLDGMIDKHLTEEHDWEVFEANFNQVHDQFFKRLKDAYPEMTPGDMRLAAYLKMNLSTKEIAPLLHISIRGVENKRYRLRKKLGLDEDANLTEFMMQF